MKYTKIIIKTLIVIIICSLLLGTLSYFDIINENTLKILQITIIFLYLFYNSYILGKNKQNKGYLEGLKYGSIISLIFILFSLLFRRNFTFYKLLYYILIILISVCGSILGINKKTKA